MTFKINNVDFSNHVIAGTYAVNNEPMVEEWKDSNGMKHRIKIRDLAKGSFDMWFRNNTEYEQMLSVLNASKTTNQSFPMSVTVNNTAEQKEANFFASFLPTRDRDGKWSDYMQQFTVEIEEE